MPGFDVHSFLRTADERREFEASVAVGVGTMPEGVDVLRSVGAIRDNENSVA
jgi:hypothetical protein